MTDDEAAVLNAAEKWLAAKEATLTADEAHQDPVETERLLDAAEAELTEAVYRLRARGSG